MNNFLNNLRKEEKLELIGQSDNISDSYIEKSANCLKSAKLLLQNDLYENSISMSYYAMYNLLVALLFKIGIKCENHAGSILLLKLLFDEKEMFEIISEAKKERIDKQYYVTTEKNEATKESAKDLFLKAENFVIKIKLIANHLNNKNIDNIRNKFKIIVN